ncbi:ABC transporter permease [Halosimplex halophilum]|uniref:ABC transporter permease n=1 Tax=Halosimplex halophilum TaxID=2559572 RepID=UPI00107FB071|nr:ABC transporter permease [Halosimplex halophilum]
MPSSDSDPPEFARVDWDATAPGRRRPSARTTGFALALLAVVGLLAYDLVVEPEKTIPLVGWDVNRSGWLVVAALVVLARYVLVPLVADRDRTARHVRAFLARPAGVLALGYLVLFALLGVLGPELFQFTYAKLDARLQPPVFAGVNMGATDGYSCVGPVVDGVCRGTWQYPLGTNRIGENVVEGLIGGMHVAVKVGVATAVVMAAVATTVGTVAGYYGGWVDDLVMRYVDVQQTIPAIVVYIVLATLFFGNVEGISDGGAFAFVLVFGLLDWGGIARLVRGEAMQRRSEGYVRAARAAGASDLHVVRRHVVPNSTATIVTALTRRIPLLVLAQVGLAYLALNSTRPASFGELLRVSLQGRHMPWHVQWWTSVPAVLLLVGLVVSFNVFGDTVRDVLDPREEVR